MAVSCARIAILVLTGLVVAPSAHAQQCGTDRRTVSFGDVKADLQDYICNVGGDGGKVRVSFYRVSELVAGALVMDAPIPAVDRIFGRLSLVQNSVLREVKTLFTNYGTSRNYESNQDISLAITPVGAKWPPPNSPIPDLVLFWTSVPISDDSKADKPVRTWHLSNSPNVRSDGILLKLPSEVTLNSDHWPSDYNMSYNCRKKTKWIISCTTIWKYLSGNDYNWIDRDLKAAAGRAEKDVSKLQEDKVRIRTGVSSIERTFALFSYLNKGKLPADFASLSSYMDAGGQDCGASNWGFSYTDRPLTLDLAIIENVGERAVNIHDLIGTKNPIEDFRAITEPATLGVESSPAPLGLGPIALPQGAKIGIALRISFRDPADPDASRQDTSQADTPDELTYEKAEETFKRIQAMPSGFMLKEVIAGFNSPRTVRKVRESFMKPTEPKVSEYAYGPETTLTGLEIEGKTQVLEGNTSVVVMIQKGADADLDLDINKIKLKAVENGENGSCPILYSWNDATQEWIYHGKVLHPAEGAARAMTEQVPLRALRTRFRIAEEEPEVSFINLVRLNVTLGDGSHLRIAPRQDQEHVIFENTAVDVEFMLPPDVKREDVVRTEIEIGGYYRRYNDILTADAEAEERPAQQSK